MNSSFVATFQAMSKQTKVRRNQGNDAAFTLFPSQLKTEIVHVFGIEAANFSKQNRRVSRSVNRSAMTSHEMKTRSFYMTQAGPLE